MKLSWVFTFRPGRAPLLVIFGALPVGGRRPCAIIEPISSERRAFLEALIERLPSVELGNSPVPWVML